MVIRNDWPLDGQAAHVGNDGANVEREYLFLWPGVQVDRCTRTRARVSRREGRRPGTGILGRKKTRCTFAFARISAAEVRGVGRLWAPFETEIHFQRRTYDVRPWTRAFFRFSINGGFGNAPRAVRVLGTRFFSPKDGAVNTRPRSNRQATKEATN